VPVAQSARVQDIAAHNGPHIQNCLADVAPSPDVQVPAGAIDVTFAMTGFLKLFTNLQFYFDLGKFPFAILDQYLWPSVESSHVNDPDINMYKLFLPELHKMNLAWFTFCCLITLRIHLT
jgi:hypothetical protein